MPTIIPTFRQVPDGYNIMELTPHEYQLIINGLEGLVKSENETRLKVRAQMVENRHINYAPELELVERTILRMTALIAELEGGKERGENPINSRGTTPTCKRGNAY